MWVPSQRAIPTIPCGRNVVRPHHFLLAPTRSKVQYYSMPLRMHHLWTALVGRVHPAPGIQGNNKKNNRRRPRHLTSILWMASVQDTRKCNRKAEKRKQGRSKQYSHSQMAATTGPSPRAAHRLHKCTPMTPRTTGQPARRTDPHRRHPPPMNAVLCTSRQTLRSLPPGQPLVPLVYRPYFWNSQSLLSSGHTWRVLSHRLMLWEEKKERHTEKGDQAHSFEHMTACENVNQKKEAREI